MYLVWEPARTVPGLERQGHSFAQAKEHLGAEKLQKPHYFMTASSFSSAKLEKSYFFHSSFSRAVRCCGVFPGVWHRVSLSVEHAASLTPLWSSQCCVPIPGWVIAISLASLGCQISCRQLGDAGRESLVLAACWGLQESPAGSCETAGRLSRLFPVQSWTRAEWGFCCVSVQFMYINVLQSSGSASFLLVTGASKRRVLSATFERIPSSYTMTTFFCLLDCGCKGPEGCEEKEKPYGGVERKKRNTHQEQHWSSSAVMGAEQDLGRAKLP